MTGVSQRAYARLRGVAMSAVQKAIASKRITPNPDGTIDPERANQEWERNTFAGRTLHQATSPKAVPPPPSRGGSGMPSHRSIERSCFGISAGPRSERDVQGEDGAVGV